MITIDQETARRFILGKQGLWPGRRRRRPEGTMQAIAEGEIVKSKVLRVTEGAVILDVGFKSEGSVPLDEFKEIPQVGDEVEVFLEHLEDQEGAVVLSKKKADFMRVWEKIRVAHESDQPVSGVLTKKIKGGMTIQKLAALLDGQKPFADVKGQGPKRVRWYAACDNWQEVKDVSVRYRKHVVGRRTVMGKKLAVYVVAEAPTGDPGTGPTDGPSDGPTSAVRPRWRSTTASSPC